jgi:hypothetical protein
MNNITVVRLSVAYQRDQLFWRILLINIQHTHYVTASVSISAADCDMLTEVPAQFKATDKGVIRTEKINRGKVISRATVADKKHLHESIQFLRLQKARESRLKLLTKVSSKSGIAEDRNYE